MVCKRSAGCVLIIALGINALRDSRLDARADGPGQAADRGASQDSGWPRTYEKHGDQVVLYQPQVDDWTDHTTIRFRAALALTPKDRKDSYHGILAVKADSFVDDQTRTVLMTNLDADVRFPDLSRQETKKLETMAREVLPKKDYLQVSLDLVLACMDASQAKVPHVKLNLDPPPIFRSESPAIMVIYMGPPQFKPIKDTPLMSAINTNWDLLLDLKTSQCCLLDIE